jgi:hypothetical protein
MKIHKMAVLCVAFSALLLAALPRPVSAQNSVGPEFHPGQTLRYDIKFAGSNAGTIKQVLVGLRLETGVASDQPSFQTALNSDWVKSPIDGVYHLSITIPDTAATGDYEVIVMTNFNDDLSITYSRAQVGLPLVRIANNRRFEIPRITVTQHP